MLGAAIPRAKRDQPGVFGIGEGHAGLGDLRQAGHRCAAAQYIGGLDPRKIGAAPGQGGLGPDQRQDQRGRQQRGELGQGDGSKLGTLGGCRLGPKPGRVGAERGGRVGQIADHRCRQVRRQRDRHCAR